MNLLTNQRTADVISGLYQDLEEQLMQNIVQHIKTYNQPIDSDDWLLQRLAEIGKLNQENIKIISQQAGISQTAVERMLINASQEAVKQLDIPLKNLAKQSIVNPAISVSKSKNVKNTVDKLCRQAKDTLNLCNTTMLYKAKDAYQTLVYNICNTAKEIEKKQSFIDVLNRNASNAVMGAESRAQAVKHCIEQFNNRGIPAFVDKAGREWTPEAYVNMAIRNTVKNVADEAQSARCKDYGINLIEIDSHSGARSKCAKDQGKIYDLDNQSGETEDGSGRKIKYYPWNSSSYGEPDGILGINCRHHKYPFVPKVHIRRYFPTEDTDANDKLYKETQIQRALERDVRKQKRECMLFDELGDKDAFEKSAVKLKAKEAKLKHYVDNNDNLHRRKDREQVVGFDKSISSKAVSTNKKVVNIADKSYNKGNTEKNVRTYFNDKKLRSKLRSNDTPKLIESGKQGKHIKGSNNYIEGNSYLTVSEAEAQELVNKYAGTGDIKRDRKGRWTNKEFITADKNMGVVVDRESGEEITTSRFSIHYSKNGVHIVPRKEIGG